MKDREIRGVIKEIEAEGNHYLRVPPLIGDWPLKTLDEAPADEEST